MLAIYTSTTAAIQAQPLEVPLYGSGRFAVYKPAANTYFYEISDHLGNVRGVIGAVTTDLVDADFESPANAYFLNYSQHDDDLMDHTDAGTVYTHSQILNGGYNGRIGVARSIVVSPGDVIKVEAYAKYRNLTSDAVNLSGFALALTGAFGLSSGMEGEAGMAYDALENYGLAIAAGDDDHHEDPGAPKAFINLLLFDKKFNFVDGAYDQISSTAEQVSDPAKDPHDYLVREVTVTEPGYAFIFLSNENLSQVDVHFDDVKVSHTHSPIVAGADYYPFGLVMETREIDDEPYRYGYQGQFSEEDLTTGMQEFELRMYDPRIGRWLSPDPYGQYASPYVGMGNLPQMNVDPDGGFSIGGCPPNCPGIWLPEVAVSASRIGAGSMVAGAARIILQDGFKTWTGRGLMIDPMLEDSPFFVTPSGHVDTSPLRTATDPAYLAYTRRFTISAHKPNFFAQLNASPVPGSSMAYGIINSGYLAVRTFFLKPFLGNDIYNLDGSYASYKERQIAFATTAASFMPAGPSGHALKFSKKKLWQKFGEHFRKFGLDHDTGIDEYLRIAREVFNDPVIKYTFPKGGHYAGETWMLRDGILLRLDPHGNFRSLYPLLF